MCPALPLPGVFAPLLTCPRYATSRGRGRMRTAAHPHAAAGALLPQSACPSPGTGKHPGPGHRWGHPKAPPETCTGKQRPLPPAFPRASTQREAQGQLPSSPCSCQDPFRAPATAAGSRWDGDPPGGDAHPALCSPGRAAPSPAQQELAGLSEGLPGSHALAAAAPRSHPTLPALLLTVGFVHTRPGPLDTAAIAPVINNAANELHYARAAAQSARGQPGPTSTGLGGRVASPGTGRCQSTNLLPFTTGFFCHLRKNF